MKTQIWAKNMFEYCTSWTFYKMEGHHPSKLWSYVK